MLAKSFQPFKILTLKHVALAFLDVSGNVKRCSSPSESLASNLAIRSPVLCEYPSLPHSSIERMPVETTSMLFITELSANCTTISCGKLPVVIQNDDGFLSIIADGGWTLEKLLAEITTAPLSGVASWVAISA